MKPQSMEFSGINSFQSKQFIDFNALTKNGTFGIFGATGSGKSSILDAVTLALFGKINRGTKKQDFINTHTRSAEVNLKFSAVFNGELRNFEVYRNFKVKKNNKDLDSSAYIYEIKADKKIPLAESPQKVDDIVSKIIGLGVDEFSKCIAIPQNEFSAFLKETPAERIETIGKIFSLEEFGDNLRIKIKDKHTQQKYKVASIKDNLSNLENANTDTISELENQLKVLTNSISQNQALIQDKQNEINKLNTNLEKLQELKVLEENSCQIKNEEPLIQKKKQKLQFNERLQFFTPKFESLRLLNFEIDNLNTDSNELKSQFNLQEAELRKCENNSSNIKNLNLEIQKTTREFDKVLQLKENESKIKTLQSINITTQNRVALINQEKKTFVSQLEVFTNALSQNSENTKKAKQQNQTIREDIVHAQKYIYSEQIQQKLSMINNIIDIINSINIEQKSEIEETSKKLKDLTTATQNEQTALETISEKIDIYNFPEKETFQKLISVEHENLNLKNGQEKLQLLKELCENLLIKNENLQNDIRSFENELSVKSEQIKKQKVEIELIEIELSNKRKEYETKIAEDYETSLKNNLHIGDNCPICNNQITKTFIKIEESSQNINQTIADLSNMLKAKQQEFAKLNFETATLKSTIQNKNLEIADNKKELRILQEKQDKIYTQFVNMSNNKELDFNERIKYFNALVDTLGKLTIAELNKKREIDSLKLSKTKNEAKLETIQENLKYYSELVSKLNSMRGETELTLLSENDDIKRISRGDLENLIKASASLDEQIQNLETDRTGLLSNLEQSKAKISDLSINCSNSEKEIEENNHVIDDLTKQIQKFCGENAVDVQLKCLSEKIDNLNSSLELVNIGYDKIKTGLTEIEKNISANKALLKDKLAKRNSLQLECSSFMESENIQSVEEVETLQTTNYELEAIKKEVTLFEINKNLNLQKRQELLQKLGTSTLEEKDISIKENELKELQNKTNKMLEDIGSLTHQIEKTKTDYEEKTRLTEELVIHGHKLNLLSILLDLLVGKALMEFVAEEYIYEITNLASIKLFELLGGRYELIYEDRSFLVKDYFDEGKTRSTATLSGGETFVVSLAISLSISECLLTTRNKYLDFFFLDEGFGSLDMQLRKTVLDVLSRVNQNGTSIGLISHFKELEDDTPNKILVTKDDYSGSHITVV